MNIKTVYDEQGRSWVEIPDDMWETATLMTYVRGMDIDYPERVQRRKNATS